MALFQVIGTRINIFPHPNAERLLLARCGNYQLVIGIDNGYEENQIVVFAPMRAILPEDIRDNYKNSDTGISYLSGPNSDRVKSVRLRGELSEGVTINLNWVMQKGNWKSIEEIPLNVDLSEILDITKWEPPIPLSLAGEVENFQESIPWTQHDVERLSIFRDEFVEGEEVVITEKINGSQMIMHRTSSGTHALTSKGFAGRHQVIKKSGTNSYWMAAENCGIFEKLDTDASLGGKNIQLVGEMIPCQGANYSYGLKRPEVRIFSAFIDGIELSWEKMQEQFPYLPFVPLLYVGPLKFNDLPILAQGMENVSGKSLNIREGIVVSPRVPRKSSKGFRLFLKIINPKYRDDDDAFS